MLIWENQTTGQTSVTLFAINPTRTGLGLNPGVSSETSALPPGPSQGLTFVNTFRMVYKLVIVRSELNSRQRSLLRKSTGTFGGYLPGRLASRSLQLRRTPRVAPTPD